MVRWLLNHVKSPILLILAVGLMVGIGVAAEAWQSRRRQEGEPRSNEMVTIAVEFVGLAYAILIGFVIVSLWQDQADSRHAVADEASALNDILTLSRPVPPSERGEVEQAVRDYSLVVVNEEWKRLRTGSDSEGASLAAGKILESITAIDTSSELAASLQSSMIDSFKEFTGLRTRRLAFAHVRLAGELWLLVILSSVVLILLVAAFEGEGKWHMGATVIVAATIGTILFVIVALSYPFSGDVSISSQPFRDLVRAVPS